MKINSYNKLEKYLLVKVSHEMFYIITIKMFKSQQNSFLLLIVIPVTVHYHFFSIAIVSVAYSSITYKMISHIRTKGAATAK